MSGRSGLTGYVRREDNQSNMSGAKRAQDSPAPMARREASADGSFKTPAPPNQTQKRPQTSNASVLRADQHTQHHPVQEQDGNVHINPFDTDGESAADTTLGDVLTISNQTYQNQPSYPPEDYSPSMRHTRMASYGQGRAVARSSRSQATVADEQDVAARAETRPATPFTSADFAAMSRITFEFGQAHADQGRPNGHGVFESGASYPSTSELGVTGSEIQRSQTEVEYDQEHEQSDASHDESEDEDEEGSVVDVSTNKRPEESQGRGPNEQQHTQRQPQQQQPRQHSDHVQYRRPLTNRGIPHQQQTDSGQGQSKVVMAATQEEAVVRAEQQRKEQQSKKQAQRLEQERQSNHWHQHQPPNNVAHGQHPQGSTQTQGSNVARETGRQQMVETKQIKTTATQQSIVEQASQMPQPQAQTRDSDVAHQSGDRPTVETKRVETGAKEQLSLFRGQRSQQPEPKTEKLDPNVALQTERQQTEKPQQVKTATMQQHSLVGGETSQQPATSQSQTEIPKRAERKHASKQPGPVDSKVVSPSEEPLQLDYDEANLRQMDYSFLRNQPFDDNPRASKRSLPDGMQSGELPERLVRGASVDQQSQAEFFKSLSLDDWEASGDWFMDQFTGLMQKMRQARREKRSIAKTFEDAVSNRQEKVAGKREELDGVLKGMKQSGSVVLNHGSTPQKTNKS